MNIRINIQLTNEIAERLQAESGDLSTAVSEAFAIRLFRRGLVTHRDLGLMLGLDRFGTDALLKRNNVTVYSLTDEEIDADVARVKELTGLCTI